MRYAEDRRLVLRKNLAEFGIAEDMITWVYGTPNEDFTNETLKCFFGTRKIEKHTYGNLLDHLRMLSYIARMSTRKSSTSMHDIHPLSTNQIMVLEDDALFDKDFRMITRAVRRKKIVFDWMVPGTCHNIKCEQCSPVNGISGLEKLIF